jgi:hypothetical protein
MYRLLPFTVHNASLQLGSFSAASTVPSLGVLALAPVQGRAPAINDELVRTGGSLAYVANTGSSPGSLTVSGVSFPSAPGKTVHVHSAYAKWDVSALSHRMLVSVGSNTTASFRHTSKSAATVSAMVDSSVQPWLGKAAGTAARRGSLLVMDAVAYAGDALLCLKDAQVGYGGGAVFLRGEMLPSERSSAEHMLRLNVTGTYAVSSASKW